MKGRVEEDFYELIQLVNERREQAISVINEEVKSVEKEVKNIKTVGTKFQMLLLCVSFLHSKCSWKHVKQV